MEKIFDRPLWQILLASMSGEFIYYFSMALAAWLFFWVLFRRWTSKRRIGRQHPDFPQIRREFLQSVRSIAVFSLVGIFCVHPLVENGWTQMYFRIDQYGWAWFWLSVPALILLHDAYFYITHRMMHHPRLFRVFHSTHHRSISPTPWAAYSFSVPEAAIQAGIAPVAFLVMPTHPLAFGMFMLWQIFFNVLGHCGHEVMPSWFMRSGVGRFINSITHHDMHHEKVRANFGLYFNYLDRLFGTNHAEYEARFEEVVTQGRAGSYSPPASTADLEEESQPGGVLVTAG